MRLDCFRSEVTQTLALVTQILTAARFLVLSLIQIDSV